MLSVDFHTGQVTAVCLYKSYVLAGIGGNIQVFDVSKSETVYSHYVFSCHNIHGIKKEPESDVFCIWGEKCFRIFKFVVHDCTVRLQLLGDVIQVEDWIWDVQWLKERDGIRSLALALGHNVVLHWTLSSSSDQHRVECVEKCILYSAHFIGNEWSCLILAAGTVFNQVVFWAVCGRVTVDGKQEVIHRLIGHDGVIFSIDYHPHRRLVASVSDDRSIRVWQVKFQSDAVVPCLEDWQSVISSPIATLYGHSARVWDIRLLHNHFVSIGEDATCCVWDYEWQVTQKFKGHKGKSIWSMGTSDDEKSVVTGGGDGSVRLWKVDSESTQTSLPVSCLLIPDHIKAKSDDYPRIVTLLNFNTILIMTMDGMLCSYCISERKWRQVFQDEDFRSYSVMAVGPNHRVIAFGSITGTLKILTQKTDSEKTLITSYHEKIFKGKVFGLCWLEEHHLLITGPQGVMILMKLDQSSDSSLHLEVMTSLFLPHCKQRWASAAMVMWADSVLVCGDKGGTVHCYSLKHQQQQQLTTKPNCSFPKIHGKAGVTDVCRQGNYVLTAGRDGHYRTWKLMAGKLELLNSNKVMKGMEWIDRLELTQNDTLVYGFHSSYFTMWSVRRNEKVMEVECGGGHRSWDCLIDKALARFVYLKSREVILFEKCLGSSQVILKPAFHGRELCDVKYITTQRDSTGAPIYLMATCSEDTTINIVSVSNTKNIPELTVHHTLQGHLSSVRALSLSAASRRQSEPNTCQTEQSEKSHGKSLEQTILFSAGGRAQIQVWLLQFCTGGNSLDSFSNISSRNTQSELYSDVRDEKDTLDSCSIRLQGDSENRNTQSELYSDGRDEKDTLDSCSIRLQGDSENRNTQSELYSDGRDEKDTLDSCSIRLQGDSENRNTQSEYSDGRDDKDTLDSCSISLQDDAQISSSSDVSYCDVPLDALNRTRSLGDKNGDLTSSNIEEKSHHNEICDQIHDGSATVSDVNSSTIMLEQECDDSEVSGTTAAQAEEDLDLKTRKFEGLHHKYSETNIKTADTRCSYEHLANCFLGDQRHGKGYKPWKAMFPKADPETRILDLTSFSTDDLHSEHQLSLHFVAVACSDGFVRLFGFNESTRSFSLLQQSDYHGNCVLKVHHFPIRHGDKLKMLLLSAATDGNIAVWDITSVCDGYIHHIISLFDSKEASVSDSSICDGYMSSVKAGFTRYPNQSVQISVDARFSDFDTKDFLPVHVMKSHQSGVNSLHVRHLENNQFMICSGGDDNCLTVCLVDISVGEDQSVTMTTRQRCHKLNAHAAQITGMWIVSDDIIVTASIDQRVCLWKLTGGSAHSLELELRNTRYVHVSDISSVDVWRDGDEVKMAVCGEGLSILTIDCKENSSFTS